MAFKDFFDIARRRLEGQPTVAELRDLKREDIRLSNPWHAVSIQPGVRRCEAVSELMGQRFLSKDAPRLPLPKCTEAECTCRYQHHDDRRLDGSPLDRNGMPLPHPSRRDAD